MKTSDTAQAPEPIEKLSSGTGTKPRATKATTAPKPAKTPEKTAEKPATKAASAKSAPKAAAPAAASPAARQAPSPKPAAKTEALVTPNIPAPTPPAEPAPIEAAAPAVAPAPEPRPMQQRPPMHGARPQPVRTPSKEERFEEGDYVVYPTHGVGKVEKIAVEDIAGHRLELIHITFEENRMTLRVPVAKARTAGLRRLATRKMFDEALAVLKGRARVKRTMWSRRAQEYEAKINSGDPTAIAEVVRDLHRNAGQPDQSFSERQIYEAAMDRLAAELAALDQSDKPAAVAKLATFLKAN